MLTESWASQDDGMRCRTNLAESLLYRLSSERLSDQESWGELAPEEPPEAHTPTGATTFIETGDGMSRLVAQLVIKMDDANAVTVEGPIENRLVCLGMLELAKYAINQHSENSQKMVTLPPPGMKLVDPK